MATALDRIRVIDIGTFQAAPFRCQILADFGAEVIRIEPPGGENLAIPLYNRNKQGVTLNLQSDKGKQLLKELVEHSDVLVTNLTARAVKSLELAYDSLSKVNPGLIYASITGYGQYGPYAERPTFDPICQAIMGHMYITGFKDTGPTKSASSLCDYGSGLYCAIGILLALRHRDKTGKGQEIDVAILDAGVSFMEAVFAQYEVLNEIQPQMGNARPFSALTDAFKCKDGYIYMAVSFNRMWRRFVRLIGRADLVGNPRFDSSEKRRRNRDDMNSLAQGWLADKTKEEAVKLLVETGIPAGPVNTVTEAIVDPQIRAREMIVDIEQPGIGKIPLSGIVVKMSQTPGNIEAPAPTVGQHNRGIYRDLLGHSEEEVVQFEEEGVICGS